MGRRFTHPVIKPLRQCDPYTFKIKAHQRQGFGEKLITSIEIGAIGLHLAQDRFDAREVVDRLAGAISVTSANSGTAETAAKSLNGRIIAFQPTNSGFVSGRK